MTNDKHTGGRWFVCLAGYRREVRSDVGLGGIGLHIATVIRDEKGPTEMDADAHLMAAAPDMLDALRKCLEEVEAVERRDQHPTLAGDLAHAAIAKAEGR